MATKPTVAEKQAARKQRRADIKAARKKLPPIAWLRKNIAPLLEAGLTDKEIATKISVLIDSLLTFAWAPGPLAALAEELDGPLAYAIAMPIVKATRRAMVKSGLVAA